MIIIQILKAILAIVWAVGFAGKEKERGSPGCHTVLT